jgi:hypothetical protein
MPQYLTTHLEALTLGLRDTDLREFSAPGAEGQLEF